MRILMYKWGACLEQSMLGILEKETVFCMDRHIEDYHADAGFSEECMQIIHREKIEAVFSFDYFPILSMLCNVTQIPYISWIYDCPMDTVWSATIGNECNHIFCFDRIFSEYIRKLGAKNCYHMPLAADWKLFQGVIEKNGSNGKAYQSKYEHEISFIGNLYNDNKNRLRQAVFSEYHRGMLEGIIQAQLKVYGYNFLQEALPEEVLREIVEKCQLKLGRFFVQDSKKMAADAVGMEVSARERELVLKKLSNEHEIHFYSGSTLPKELKNGHIKEMGFADYQSQMPIIFANSQINLNITSKTIQSGIPQRVLDILACGGFCMTNYQPEIAELFENGKELVMYEGMDDLLEKADYYLTHDAEREAIAQAGFSKIKQSFTLEERWKEMRFKLSC